MPTTTTNYSLEKPLVNNATDQDLWGGQLNDDMDDIDTLLRVGITIAPQSSQTTGFTADASISVKKLYPCDTTAAGFTATIPAAATAGSGATVFIKKTDATANIVTLARSSTDTLDGATSLTLEAQNATYGLVSDGTSKWFSVCKPSQVIPDASTTVKGIIEIATDAEYQTGTATDKAIVPSNIVKSLATSGYARLGPLIIQWGETSSFSTSITVTFPLAFPTGCLQAYCGSATAPTGITNNPSASSLTTTTFLVTSGTATAVAMRWMAIGY